MKNWKRTAHHIEELPEIAADLLNTYGEERVFAFYGDMGAGKTTFIKEICHLLGVKGEVSSPTFSIINEYLGKEDSIFHFDFYRIEKEEEAFDIGSEEYFYSGSYCFIEWAQKVENLLPPEAIKIYIREVSPTKREFHLTNTK